VTDKGQTRGAIERQQVRRAIEFHLAGDLQAARIHDHEPWRLAHAHQIPTAIRIHGTILCHPHGDGFHEFALINIDHIERAISRMGCEEPPAVRIDGDEVEPAMRASQSDHRAGLERFTRD
jgi:hypothetical protein